MNCFLFKLYLSCLEYNIWLDGLPFCLTCLSDIIIIRFLFIRSSSFGLMSLSRIFLTSRHITFLCYISFLLLSINRGKWFISNIKFVWRYSGDPNTVKVGPIAKRFVFWTQYNYRTLYHRILNRGAYFKKTILLITFINSINYFFLIWSPLSEETSFLTF